MARVFTITEGLENMGALKTGGQGSVYKGRRIGEIITAIKLLPTPVHSETAEDKNYSAFLNEVNKLKKVNKPPNPNVVKIVNSGITTSGNFPYIEMEFIEGPDLEELLKPPHDPVFSVHELLKVAHHLSNALSHCHKAGVRHGDIKSNNVKLNNSTGNYILLDFGLAIMSNEQRRTSLRHAGAIEFMAPEQNEGVMLFETDVYSFGVVLYELLCGTVPFPLNDKSETGRNSIMVAHLETPPPDMLVKRKRALPAIWSEAEKQKEMQVPAWVVDLVYKCLEKQPQDRFADGMALHQYIAGHLAKTLDTAEAVAEQTIFLREEIKRLQQERTQLQQQLLQYKQQAVNEIGSNAQTKIFPAKQLSNSSAAPKRRSIKPVLLIVALIAAASAIGFVYLKKPFSALTAKNREPTVAARKVTALPPLSKVDAQLITAKQFLNTQKTVEALIIYSQLAKAQVPEAMYQYGKLALQDKNLNITCTEAFDLLKNAAANGYAPAKRSLGFLYSFADNKEKLQQSNYYERCVFGKNVKKGSQLLMEAVLAGDTAASRLLNELNSKSKP